MKVLVTGGAGYVGTVLTELLLNHGYHVRCYDTLTFGVDPVLPFFRNPQYELIQADVRSEQELRSSLDGVDAIVHLAAIVGYEACKRDPYLAREVNVAGTRILNQARSAGQMLVFASTGSTYGAVETGLCTEETPLNPLSVYGRTKVEAESILLDRGNAVCYRFATAFGLSPRMRLDLLVNDFCHQAVQHRNLILYEAHFRRTFIHVYDMARAVIHALDHFHFMRDQVYNCGDERMNASKLEIAKLIQRQVKFYLHIADVGKDEDQRNYEVSYQKIRDTGYRAEVSLEEGTAELIRACRFLRLPNPYSNLV